MSAVEAVIFDLGNVLIPYDENLALERLCAATGHTRREVENYMLATPHVNQLVLGQMSRQRFFETVSRDLGFAGSYEDFARIWWEIFAPAGLMVEFAQKLKGRVRRFVLSNTNAIHMDYVFAHYPFLSEMECVILSHEVGLLKPDRRIYELALEKFSLTAARTVFIDDLATNVDGARAAGLVGIQFHSVDQVRQELTKLGVTPI